MKIIISIFVAVMALFEVAAYAAQPLITVSSTGNGKFTVHGASMSAVSGIMFTIGYNSSLLGTPTVKQGAIASGAYMSANTGVPGIIKVAIITTNSFSDDGEVVSLAFTNQNAVDGISTIKIEELIGANRNALTGSAAVNQASGGQRTAGEFYNTPGVPFVQERQNAGQQDVKAVQVPQNSSSSTGSVGTLAVSLDNPQQTPPQISKEQEKNDTEQIRSVENRTVSATPEQKSVPVPTPAPPKVEELKQTVIAGVIDRFKGYRGEKSAAILSVLFTTPPSQLFSQMPSIAVSDGAAAVIVRADLTGAPDSGAPNFALSEAKLLSLKMGENPGNWLIELVPIKGSLYSKLTILAGNTITELPLTVVSPVADNMFTEKEANLFFKDSGAVKPIYDLNGDGKHDYIDDFIYTAHFILQKEKPNYLEHNKKAALK